MNISKKQTKYDLEERLVKFAAGIIDVVEALPKSVTGKHIAGQLIRSGTSPAANYREAESAELHKDFFYPVPVYRD
jgi:four helix bundle protein